MGEPFVGEVRMFGGSFAPAGWRSALMVSIIPSASFGAAVALVGALDRGGDVSDLNVLMDMLERRVTMLGMLRHALGDRDIQVRIGTENDQPALQSLAMVAAAYGLPQRSLGAVSVIGPLRMNYGGAIRAVREAAAQLSSFVAEVYDER